MSQSRNFCYFGTPSVASETLTRLLEAGMIPSLVVTSPDRPQGRGLALTPSPVKSLALAHNIPVLTPEKLDAAAIGEIVKTGCTYGIAVAYGKILPQVLIEAFPLGILNVHYSLLPKYRGATPLEAALLAGDSVTGVTIQKMVYELDAGDIIVQEEMPIAPSDTARELRPRLIDAGANLLVRTLPAFERGEIVPTPQDASLASRAGKRTKEDGLLELGTDAELNWNKYRAYADTIGTYFFENGKRMKVTKASFKNGAFVVERIIPEGKSEREYHPT